MNLGTVGIDPQLPDECRHALESWLCDDPATREVAGHLERCPSCRELAEGIRLDQELLRWQLRRIAPPPSRRLELREPLAAASGHPRRVSLAVLPFLIAVMLALLLGAAFLLGRIGQGRQALLERAGSDLATIDRLLREHLPAPAGADALPPHDWAAQLRAVAPASLAPIPGGERLLDPFGRPYRIRVVEGNWRVYSTGPDRVDAAGSADDLLPR